MHVCKDFSVDGTFVTINDVTDPLHLRGDDTARTLTVDRSYLYEEEQRLYLAIKSTASGDCLGDIVISRDDAKALFAYIAVRYGWSVAQAEEVKTARVEVW